jgi:hypothetical protein
MKNEICQMTSKFAGQPTTSVMLEIPIELLEQVKQAAALEKSDYQALINCYIHHGLADSQAQVKWKLFTEHAKEVLEKHNVQSDTIAEVFNSKFLH